MWVHRPAAPTSSDCRTENDKLQFQLQSCRKLERHACLKLPERNLEAQCATKWEVGLNLRGYPKHTEETQMQGFPPMLMM